MLALVFVMLIAGFAARSYRLVWAAIVLVPVLVAALNWRSGAYEDSGNALGYSALIVAALLGPALLGAAFGWVARRFSTLEA